MTDPARGPTTEELRAAVLAQSEAAGEEDVEEAPLRDGASAPTTGSSSAAASLVRAAVDQIRDALAVLSYASDGFYEDEAQVALDALDWLEARVPPLEPPLEPPLDERRAEHLGSAPMSNAPESYT